MMIPINEGTGMSEKTPTVEDEGRITEKEILSELEALRKASWDRYTARRDYEWKILLGYWGVLVAGASALLEGKLGSDHLWLTVGAFFAVVVAFLLQVGWVAGVRHGNDRDRAAAAAYEEKIEELIGFQSDKWLVDRRARLRELATTPWKWSFPFTWESGKGWPLKRQSGRTGFLKWIDWAQRFQLGTTFLLCIALVCSAWVGAENATRKDRAEISKAVEKPSAARPDTTQQSSGGMVPMEKQTAITNTPSAPVGRNKKQATQPHVTHQAPRATAKPPRN